MDWSFGEDQNLNLEFSDGVEDNPPPAQCNLVIPQNDENHDEVVRLCNEVHNLLVLEISKLQGQAPNQFFIGNARYFDSIPDDSRGRQQRQQQQGQVNVEDSVSFHIQLDVFNRCTPSPASEVLNDVFIELLRRNSGQLEIIPESVEMSLNLNGIIFKFTNGVVVSLVSMPGRHAVAFEDLKP